MSTKQAMIVYELWLTMRDGSTPVRRKSKDYEYLAGFGWSCLHNNPDEYLMGEIFKVTTESVLTLQHAEGSASK